MTLAALTVAVAFGTVSIASAHPSTVAKKKPKPPTFLTIVYDAQGTSLVKKPDSTVSIGPTKLTSVLNNSTNDFTGSLPIPDTTSAFKVLGLIPVTATASFIANGPVTGHLTQTGSVVTVASKSSYYLRLSNVMLAGIPTDVGPACQTAEPVEIDPATPAGQSFNVFSGGNLSAVYTIGDLANCGLTTGLINALVPGPDNTVNLVLSNGQLQLP